MSPIDKGKIIHRLYERDFSRMLHKQLVEGLVGVLRDEYLCRYPRESHAIFEEPKSPVFHALVKMTASILLHYTTEKLVHEVMEVIEEIKKEEGNQ